MTATVDLEDIDFSGAMTSVRDGLLIKPLFQLYIEQAEELCFPQMSPRDVGERDPDGLFHPSSHPGWSARQLYEYLVHPGQLEREPLSYEAKMSMFFGSFFGGWKADVLLSIGVLEPPPPCRWCPPAAGCREASFLDPETGSFGHVDGLVDPELTPVPATWENKETQENTWAGFKRLKEMRDLDNGAFVETWPSWYEQALEYQRLSGRRMTIFTVGIAGYPWLVREFHVVYDAAKAEEVAAKYRRVRQAAADQRPPACMCDRKGAVDCVARRLCP